MKKAIIFALAVCGVSWAVFGIFYAIVGNGLSENPALLQSISVLYMFLPLITALLLQKIRKVSPLSTGLLNFKFSWAWIMAIAIPYVILLLSILVSTLVPGAKLEPSPENIIASSGLEGAAADAVREQCGFGLRRRIWVEKLHGRRPSWKELLESGSFHWICMGHLARSANPYGA